MIWMLVCMLLLLALGVPVAFAMAISAGGFMLFCCEGLADVVVAQQIVSGTNSFILLAIPFFILAGELMNAGGVTRRMVNFALAAIGRARGGLTYVVIAVNVIMACVSGVAIANAAAVGSVLIPSMVRKGYGRGFSAAVNCASATIGPVIPPSVGFLIYASLSNVSVGKMFAAGALPGLLMAVYMMVTCYVMSRRRNLPRGEKASVRAFLRAGKEAFWALFMPVIILGGILGGIVTPTEAGVLAVVYGMVVSVFVYRELRLSDLPRILVRAARQSAIVLFIIACAQVFGWVLTREGAPELMLHAFGNLTDNTVIFLLIINVLILVLGCFMEGGSIMIILTPLLMPLLAHYGVDPIHFGVVFQLNIMVGLITPPVGMLLFVVSGVSKIPVPEILRDMKPFYIALLLCLLALTYIPAISLWLPSMMN